MSSKNEKQFDFDAFNAVLQKSTAICANGRRDIDAAIKAGKGEATVLPGIYTCEGTLRFVFQLGKDKFVSFTNTGGTGLPPYDEAEFVKEMKNAQYKYFGPLSQLRI